jgi:hypothetical protein
VAAARGLPELLSTSAPPARSAAPLIRSGRRVLAGDCAGLRGRIDRFVQRHTPRTRVRPTPVGVAERTRSGSQASIRAMRDRPFPVMNLN